MHEPSASYLPFVALPSGGFEVRPPSLRETLLGGGPRLARDAFGPPLAFYVGWKLVGLPLGIGAATATSVLAHRLERRAGRPGVLARFALGLVFLQAVIGLASGSERVYLAQPVLVNGLLGLVFLGSVALRRPLAAMFADEVFPIPGDVRSSRTFRRAFARVSLVWGVYLCLRCVFRLYLLTAGSVEAYLVINFVTGMPSTALLLSWSIWYAVRVFRRSEEWGPVIRALEAGTEPA